MVASGHPTHSRILSTRRVRFRRSRRGSASSTLTLCTAGIFVLGIAGAQLLGGGIGDFWNRLIGKEEPVEFLTTQAVEDTFVHSVLERGEVESSSNVEVRCEVRGRTSSTGTNILEIVPEGTRVYEGDFLVRLDDSLLQTQLIQQQIVCSNSESSVIEAQASLDSADLALKEYEEGTFRELQEQQESNVFVAEENMRRAEEYIEYSKRLAERGYIPEAQLEADTFALEKAKKELGVAQTKLEVLESFTKEKMLTQLRANIETARAKLAAKEKTWQLDKLQLQEIEQQIGKCTIVAPADGQVVYANRRTKSSSTTALIEEGMPVRERQTIIQLPDPANMQVVAKVHESRIGHVSIDQTAKLILDSMPEIPLTGEVVSVSEYPLPPISVYMSHVKEYEVVIRINSPPTDLRPGMTAAVDILVAKIDNAVQIPIECIVQRNDQFYCAVPTTDGSLETRKIQVGPANETNVIIEKGLAGGEAIVLNLGDEEVLELLDLPEQEEQ